ncbi:MAG: UDP-N-acetylmuramoyl-tripeptide--D-alanyl-D-alanine ligase, partial [Bacteroidales bacterium]|nr:UDP-N-acetylmuramoyl-tripeptide--D-alanyl-D-alanine ligase [Bacteroidales bacterium]
MKESELYTLIREQDLQIVTDSRIVEDGDIFFALRGDNFDGNAFANVAIEKGAAFAVIDDPRYSDDKFILVEETLRTLQDIAILHRDMINCPVLAVTGSNGKTTTKELLSAILNRKFNVHSTTGNLNNHIGVPLTILAAPANTDFMIIEMGANHIGEIDELCRIARPDYGLITNIGAAHLEGFGSREGVITAKSELYNYLALNRGIVFFNGENILLNNLVNEFGIKGIKYIGSVDSHIRIENANLNPWLCFELIYDNEIFSVETNLFGLHNIENIQAAFTVGLHFGVEAGVMVEVINSYTPDNNRSQVVETDRNTVIRDAYNANPVSMSAALSSFISSGYAPKSVILGDMLELGNYSVEEHRKIVEI